MILFVLTSLLATSIYSMENSEPSDDEDPEQLLELMADDNDIINAEIEKETRQFLSPLFSPLYFATYDGDLDQVRLLIDQHANVNQPSPGGFIPLHIAAARGYHELVKILIEAGSDINKQDEDGLTPLNHAALGGHKKTAGTLIVYGAKVNVPDYNNFTPLQNARKKRHRKIVNLIKRVNKASDDAKKQLLALFCAGHSRLGAASPIGQFFHTDNAVAPLISKYLRQAAIEDAIYNK